MGDAPRSERFDDIYFSTEDGIGETRHVFFDGNNLPAAWQGRDRFTIAETGFGTGLNFLLAWELFDRTAKKGAFLDFISVEKFPLAVQDIRRGLSPWTDRLAPYLDKMLAQYPIRVPGFHRMIFDGRVALTLVFDDANDALPQITADVDAWFLDGFTPSKNPDMWTEAVFEEMARLSKHGATFSTFTAAGFVKRGLQSAGFDVEKRKGFGSKRDMLGGHYEGSHTDQAVQLKKKIAIAGAGLAGCSLAYVLKQYGFTPVLYDPNGIASGASGNRGGIINPRFTAFRTAESDFYTAAFAQTVRSFPLLDDIGYKKCGALHLVTDEDKEKRFSRTATHWGWPDEHMRLVDVAEASMLAGMALPTKALYLPDSARVDPHALCHAYVHGVEFTKDKAPDDAILANGAAAKDHPAYPDLPIHTVRGQITYTDATLESADIKTNICYGGYISPAWDGTHIVGSTFQKWLFDTMSRAEDDCVNLENLQRNIPALPNLILKDSRAALRTASSDRFPIVGARGGRLISTAHGSHGIATTLAAAHLLSDILRGGPFCLGKETIKALSPKRFSLRAAQKSSQAQ